MKRFLVLISLVLATMSFATDVYADDVNAAVVSSVVVGDEAAVSAMPVEPSEPMAQAAQDSVAVVDGAIADESAMERLTRFCLNNLNYGTITLFMAIESSFIPFPSEAVVPPAAWKASLPDSDMNIFLVFVFATLGALIGALVNYYLAMWLGRPIIYKFANSRIGHMCLLSEEKVKNAENYFEKHGAVSTFVGRLVPAVRQLISIPAGLARMGMGRFLLYTALGAGAWNAILAALGYYMSTFPGMKTEEDVMNKVKEYSSEIGWVFIGLAVAVVAYLVYKGMKKK